MHGHVRPSLGLAPGEYVVQGRCLGGQHVDALVQGTPCVHHGFRVERDPGGRWPTFRPDGSEIVIGTPLVI